MPGAMPHAARLGVSRGLIESRQQLTNPQELSFTVFWAASYVVVLVLQRDSTLAGTDLSLALATLPSVIALSIASAGVLDVAGTLSVQREDGTLLRAKAVPHGMTGFVVARVVSSSVSVVLSTVAVLIAGLIVVPDLAGTAGLAGWLTLVPIFALGMVATLPWGAVAGALAKTPGSVFGVAMLPIIGITAISGIFYPISALPGWLASLGQVFPVYWLGLGIRGALLPDAAVAAEIGQSWRTAETLGMLGAWAALGLVLAPVVLRRMARRESGADLAERRNKAMQRYA